MLETKSIMKQTITFMLFIAALTLTGCKDNTPIVKQEGFDYGAVANNKYTNKFFNIEMDVPAGWDVQDQQQRDALMKEGQKVAAGDNEMMKAQIKASEINSANLLTVYQHKIGAAVEYNPSFMLVAENLKNFPAIKSGDQYLDNAKKLLTSSAMKITHIDDKYAKKTINGLDFHAMNVTMDVNGVPVYQMYMATVKDGFALGFIYSYGDETQKTQLEKVANSIAPYKQ